MVSLIQKLGIAARESASTLAATNDDIISSALRSAAANIDNLRSIILDANQQDIQDGISKGLNSAMLDRLRLTDDRLKSIQSSIRLIADLPDPVGRVLHQTTRPNGLNISRISVPLGVLGIIYESRPNVTADAISLSLKSRNCAILRGGSESLRSSKALFKCFSDAVAEHNLPAGCIGFVDDTDRALVGEMLAACDLIDVIVPRGGKGLTERVMSEAKMPVFAHLDGICHVYIDISADIDKARPIIVNAKMRRTGICGAAETLLIDQKIPDTVAKTSFDDLVAAGCSLVGDKRAQSIHASVQPATEDDWSTEYLDAKISIKFVDGVEAAVTHINTYGSHHTDSIIAEDKTAIDFFLSRVDSAIVMHNASTQFADGGEFGMGAEIGIATGRFHARGPVGAEQLTTYKYIVEGDGQTRP